jgi:hypothetical protein
LISVVALSLRIDDFHFPAAPVRIPMRFLLDSYCVSMIFVSQRPPTGFE